MRKFIAGLACVMLAVIIAVISVGCGSGGGELTYTGDSQSESSSGDSTLSTGTSSTQSSVETMLYPLTTQQGETVAPISTSAFSTEIPTMSYDPVTITPIPTEYVPPTTQYIPPTTQYVPPTYTPEASNPVTTKPVTTTEPTTEKPIKYKNVNAYANGEVDGNKIKICISDGKDIFGSTKFQAKDGNVTIDYGSTKTYRTSCKVLSKLNAAGEAEVVVDIPSDLATSVESSGEAVVYVTVPKGLILSDDRISNNSFSVPIYM